MEVDSLEEALFLADGEDLEDALLLRRSSERADVPEMTVLLNPLLFKELMLTPREQQTVEFRIPRRYSRHTSCGSMLLTNPEPRYLPLQTACGWLAYEGRTLGFVLDGAAEDYLVDAEEDDVSWAGTLVSITGDHEFKIINVASYLEELEGDSEIDEEHSGRSDDEDEDWVEEEEEGE